MIPKGVLDAVRAVQSVEGSFRKKMQDTFIQDPNTGRVFPSGGIWGMHDIAQNAQDLGSGAISKEQYIQKASRPNALMMGLTNPVQGGDVMAAQNAVKAGQDIAGGTRLITQPNTGHTYGGQMENTGVYELNIYDKNTGKIIRKSTYGTTADMRNAMSRIALGPNEIAMPRDVTPENYSPTSNR